MADFGGCNWTLESAKSLNSRTVPGAKALLLGIKKDNIFIEDLREEFVRDYVRAGDAVLFKGSRGVQVEKALEHAFGEAAGVLEQLRK